MIHNTKSNKRETKKQAPKPKPAPSDWKSLDDNSSLHPLQEDIIANQATQNIGTLGHVGHGKTTLVEALTGIKTIKFQSELVRNITIKLGYANFKIFRCPYCPPPQCYSSGKSSTKSQLCSECNSTTKLIRHFSFVDCPGHDVLLATMLNGAAVMDAAILLIAGNQPVPQPQTTEHLAAAEVMKIKNMICVQTKLDLVKEEKAKENHVEIEKFLKGTVGEGSPVIPISCTANWKMNVDILLQYLVETIPIPIRDFKSPPQLMVVRSFDINVPGTEIPKLKGGVAGGTLKKGILQLEQVLEIRPGLILEDPEKGIRCIPLFTKVKSLFSEQNSMKMAIPGGLIAIGTTLDPTLTMGDRLVGQMIGIPGHLPPVYQQLEIRFQLMNRVVGMKNGNEKEEEDEKSMKIQKIRKDETLLVNIGSLSSYGKVLAVKEKVAKLLLKKPCCVEIGESISLSRSIQGGNRLIGCAQILYGEPLPLDDSYGKNIQ